MWGVADAFLRWLETMSLLRQVSVVVGAALLGANSLLLFSSTPSFSKERLLLDLFFTTVIVIVVGYPLGLIFIGQNCAAADNGFGTRPGVADRRSGPICAIAAVSWTGPKN